MLNFGKNRYLPSIIQAESGECGLACLAMVTTYYGREQSLTSLRKKYYFSSHGGNLKSIITIANGLGLGSRPIRVDVERIKELKLPAILHWNFDHYVVLKKVSNNQVTIHDPAVGVRTYSNQELAKQFTGVALELTPTTQFWSDNNELGKKLTLKDFWVNTNAFRISLLQVILLSILVQIFALVSPLYLQIVVDEVLIKSDQDLLFLLAFGFLCITLLSVATKAIREFASLYLVNQLGYSIGDSLMHHLMRLPLEFFEKRHIGDILSRFNSSQAVRQFITEGSVTILIDGLLSITTLILMLIYSPRLAFVVVISVIIYALFRLAQFRSVRNATLEKIATAAQLDSVFLESLRSIQSIKLANKEAERQNMWRNQFATTINADARLSRLAIFYETANTALTGVEYILVILLGSQLVLTNVFSIGMLYAFIVYRGHFSNAMLSMVNQFLEYLMLQLHLDRLDDITGTEIEPGLSISSDLVIPISGRLELSNAEYTYSTNDPNVLENINIDVREGETIAILGPSGVGKTTLLKIMMGLLKPTKGNIKIDSRELNTGDLTSYRRQIAAVSQGDALFSGNLRENIAFLDLIPNPENILKASQIACIHDEICEMPMGYDALIGDMGSALSLGQQQRVLIARALYSKPKILFLDEGTAHVHGEIEKRIFQNLRALNITCVFVTHNPQLLEFADKVIHLSRS